MTAPAPAVERRSAPEPAWTDQRVVMLRSVGAPGGFEVVLRPMPEAGPGEVRVRVLAASVQATDLLIRRGQYPGMKQQPPLVLGYDVVGEIDQLGPGVTQFMLGERVADLTVTGSYARYRTLRADRLTRLPPNVDAAQAACLVLSWVTAYQLLHRQAAVVPGQHMFVPGAAGAVGQALLALGKLAGLSTCGSARASQAPLLEALGATALDSANLTQELVPGRFDVVFDGIGAKAFKPSWAALKPDGKLCAFGFADAVKRQFGLFSVASAMLRIQLWKFASASKRASFYSITAMRKQHPAWFHADLEKLFELLAEGKIHPHINQIIGLEDVADAHRRLEAGGVEGKIVLCP